ncbi:hypothetical protein Tco_0964916, partial [Tanacetum coccineum]
MSPPFKCIDNEREGGSLLTGGVPASLRDFNSVRVLHVAPSPSWWPSFVNPSLTPPLTPSDPLASR